LIVFSLLTILVTVSAVDTPPKNDYGKPDSWLCRPGRTAPTDACAAADQTATVVTSKGKLKIEKWRADPKAPVDCFYVYPTVSLDKTGNSDMIADAAERNVIHHQFARFASQCRVYAPMYRQVTLTALRAGLTGKPLTDTDRALPYADVRDAWNYYLQHDNKRRGVVLIGHSQGSGVLTRLIHDEIDQNPDVRKRLISALLLGTNLPLPRGKDVGGAFMSIPICRSSTQTGCVVAFASFRATEPPPKNTLFGSLPNADRVAACVNPAGLLAGTTGSIPLRAYLSSGASAIATSVQAKPWLTPAPKKPITTPFVAVPGLLSGECVNDANGSYLAVKVNADPSDPRTDEIAGDVISNGIKLRNWGLHLIDVHLVMGDLIELVGKQSKAWLAATAAAQ
jgi:hypothetical protein